MHVYAVRARLVVGCVLLSALAGCGGDPPTPPPFTPATSPTPTGPVEPVLPEAAKEPTEAGAKAFAEFYWEMANYAQLTGDTTMFRRLSAKTCEPCASGADGVERVYAAGGVIRGGSYSTRVVNTEDASTNVTAFAVTVRLTISAQLIDYPGTKKDEHAGANSGTARMRLNFLHGAWLVAYLEAL